MKIIKRNIISLLLCSGLVSLNADNPFVTTYMRNYPQENKQEEVTTRAAQQVTLLTSIKKMITDPFGAIAPKPLTSYESHLLVSSFLINHLSSTDLLNAQTTKDLNIIWNEMNPEYSLLKRCFKTITVSGDFYLAHCLSNPIADVEVLQKRQEIIKILAYDQELRETIQELLQVFSQYEDIMPELWRNDYEVGYQRSMLRQIYFARNTFLSPLDDSPLYNHWDYMDDYTSPILGLLNAPFLMSTIGYTAQFFTPQGIIDAVTPDIVTLDIDTGKYVTIEEEKVEYESTLERMTAFLKSLWGFPQYMAQFPAYYGGIIGGERPATLPFVVKNLIVNRPLLYASFEKNSGLYTLMIPSTILGLWQTALRISSKKIVMDFIHVKMNKVAALIRSMEKLSQVIAQHPELNDNLVHVDGLHNYWSSTSTISVKMKEVLRLLKTATFDSTTQFALRGRVKTVYRLLEEVKNELIPGLIAIGEMDAYVTAAQVYKDSENTNTPFSFAVYETSTSTPIIVMTNMWNPLVDRDVVVPNSITMGLEEFPRNVIITGPNSGGKTTFLRGFASTVLFAQTLGIVPAQSLRITPFSTIRTYMFITDNIMAGQGLLQAEGTRVYELLKKTEENAAQGLFTLSIIDELFSGTAPEYGIAASCVVSKSLGSIPSSITLISTHFVDAMSKLEADTEFFKNYKVDAEINPDGTIYYPFTVTPGVSSINVVDAIFHKIGFNNKIIQDFQAQLAGK